MWKNIFASLHDETFTSILNNTLSELNYIQNVVVRFSVKLFWRCLECIQICQVFFKTCQMKTTVYLKYLNKSTLFYRLHFPWFRSSWFVFASVFAKHSANSKVYSYLAVNSILDMITAIVTLPSSILRYSKFSICTNNSACNIYFLYFLLYLTRVIQMNSAFVNIVVSMHRYKYMENKHFNYELKTFICIYVGILCVPLLIFLPNLFAFDIQVRSFQDTNTNMTKLIYSIGRKDSNAYIKVLLMILNYLVYIVVFIVLCIVNALLISQLKKTNAKRLFRNATTRTNSTGKTSKDSERTGKSQNSEQQKQTKLKRPENTETMIIIWITFIQAYDIFIVILSATRNTFLHHSPAISRFISMLTYVSIPFVRCLNFFVYWRFSRIFKMAIKKIFKI